MPECVFCGKTFPQDFKVYRSSLCPACGAEVKVCRNCRFYAPGAQWDCRENISEAVKDKERANFCGFFELAGGKPSGRAADKKEAARDLFNNLFDDA